MPARKKAQEAAQEPQEASETSTPALGAPEPRSRVLGPEEAVPAASLSGRTFADRARARKAAEDKAVASEDSEAK